MAFDAIPSVTHRVVSADFFTPSYRIVGKMMVPNTGIMGLVNDPGAAYMEILDARMARAHMPSKLVDHYEVIRIVKTQIFAISMARREDLGPPASARGGYVRMTEFPLRITTPVYELDGTLEWAGRFEFSSIMVDGTHDFIPMYNTIITAILLPALRVESPAVLFNRKQVDILALKNQRLED
jgi:hypothetical protein